MILERNLQGLCQKFGIDYQQFLSDFNIENAHELSIYDLQAICEEYEVDLQALLFTPLFHSELHRKALQKIKFLLLDVDGVMTDGGMYVSEHGDQLKKYNTKDGMGLLQLKDRGIQIGIISSGFSEKMVKQRADLLGINHCYVGRTPKMHILQEWLSELQLSFDEIAMIGDDINDLEIIKSVGFSACPKDAVSVVKSHANVILSKNGGDGCIREFIDVYLMPE